jgi:hypothetical protein
MNYGHPQYDDYVLPQVEDLDEIELFDEGMDEVASHSFHVGEEF